MDDSKLKLRLPPAGIWALHLGFHLSLFREALGSSTVQTCPSSIFFRMRPIAIMLNCLNTRRRWMFIQMLSHSFLVLKMLLFRVMMIFFMLMRDIGTTGEHRPMASHGHQRLETGHKRSGAPCNPFPSSRILVHVVWLHIQMPHIAQRPREEGLSGDLFRPFAPRGSTQRKSSRR